MFKQIIRTKVFETNSSSAHTFIVYGKPDDEMPQNIKDSYNSDTGTLYIDTNDYNWDLEAFYSASDKLDYLMTSILFNKDEQLEEHMNVLVEFYPNMQNICLNGEYISVRNTSGDFDFNWFINHVNEQLDRDPFGLGYIDHESYGNISFNKETLKNIVFNDEAIIYTGNDNTYGDNIPISDLTLKIIMDKYGISEKKLETAMEKNKYDMKSNQYKMKALLDLCKKHEVISPLSNENYDFEQYLKANENLNKKSLKP